MEEKRYLISDAAKQVKVESHVLRYWEDELELPIRRNKLGHRYYTADDVDRLKRIKSMKEEGFQLKAIRKAIKREWEAEENGNAGGAAQEGAEKIMADIMAQKEGKQAAKDIQGAERDKEGKIEEKTEEKAEDLCLVQTERPMLKDGERREKEEKAYRLQMLLKNMMLEAIREGNEEFAQQIKESILKELDYQFRMQEEREELRESERIRREEEHYKKIDEMLREKMEKKEKKKKHSIF